MENSEKKAEDLLRLNHPAQQHGGLATATGDVEDDGGVVLQFKARNSYNTLAEQEKTEEDGDRETRRHGDIRNRQSVGGRETGVDITEAEKHFATLQRELSHVSRQLSRQQSHRSGKRQVQDLEKAGSAGTSDDGQVFDLEETLRGNKQLEDDAGIKGKRIGVLWENLTVKALGGARITVPTFPDAFTSFFGFPIKMAMSLLGFGRKGKEVAILRNFSGVAKPGEMVLVLGRPGSGCTTFLKVIANQRFGYTGIDGEVKYGPFSSKDFEKRYRGEAVYCQEDDVHHPTL